MHITFNLINLYFLSCGEQVQETLDKLHYFISSKFTFTIYSINKSDGNFSNTESLLSGSHDHLHLEHITLKIANSVHFRLITKLLTLGHSCCD